MGDNVLNFRKQLNEMRGFLAGGDPPRSVDWTTLLKVDGSRHLDRVCASCLLFGRPVLPKGDKQNGGN